MENEKIKWINETTERYKILVDSMLDFTDSMPNSEFDISQILDYKDPEDAEKYIMQCKRYIFRIIDDLESANRRLYFSLAYIKRHKENKYK